MKAIQRTIALGICLALPFSLLNVTATHAQSRTYTLDADFIEGTLLNVNHDDPNHDQLQLNPKTTTPFPFVNIACSNRGTIVRIDVNTGTILGEYRTAPDGMGRDPSRTTVDLLGNVWVSNRDEGGISDGQNKGSVARIGLVIGGTRGDKNPDGSFTPDPNGQYLQPPFQYNTCIDRDGDGLIKTSRGLGNFLPWTNAGGVDTHGGVSTAEDESIINYTRVTGSNTRTVAVDANNDLWTGGADTDHEKISGVTGLPIPGTQFNDGCGGYGGLIDGNGVLWSARFGSNPPLRYDTNTMTGVCLGPGRGDYGFGIDPQTGEIWHTFYSGNQVAKLDAAGNVLGVYAHGSYYSQGVAVDGSGNVWVAHSLNGATTVGHLRTDGTHVGNVSLPGGSGPTGVAVDANGKIWVANYNTSNAMRIDPNAGAIGGGGFPIGAVDLTVDLNAAGGVPAYPYNYSDMTGFVAIGSTAPSGTWTVVFDGENAGRAWGTVSWNSIEPAETNVSVAVRAADDILQLPLQTFEQVTNGVSFCELGVTGQFIEIRTILSRQPGVDDTPILHDLTVRGCLQEVALDIKPQSCPNPLKTKDQGVLPAAILGNADVDVTAVDVATVKLEGVSPLRSELQDVATPFSGVPQNCSDCTTAGADGQMDLTLKFDAQAVVAALGAVTNFECRVLTLTGNLLDGTPIQGKDVVRIQTSPTKDGGKEVEIVVLNQNHPNPFNPETEIRFQLPEAAHVVVKVFNTVGQEIRRVADVEFAAGSHAVRWDGRDQRGEKVPSGVYFYQLITPNFSETRRMVLAK